MSKSFLASQSSTFTIDNANVYIVGQSGNQVITLNAAASGASFTQTIERVVFQGATNSYSYKNSAGKLEVYSASTLVATINPQDDATGTQLTFSDHSVSLAYGSAGSLTLGGLTIPTISATLLTPTAYVTTLEGDTAGSSSAKVFLESSESSFTISNSNISVVGQSGQQVLTVKAGVTGSAFTQTIEKVIFEDTSTNYTYVNNAGKLDVYSGTSIVATINPQDDDTGTELTFTNETKDIKFGTTGGLTLGGATVSTASTTPATTNKTTMDLISNTTAVNGVAENFTYLLTSNANGDVVSKQLVDITLSGFKVGEDSLTFIDNSRTVSTTKFFNDVIISASTLNNLTDIIFATDDLGKSLQLTLTGIVDSSLSTVAMTVA